MSQSKDRTSTCADEVEADITVSSWVVSSGSTTWFTPPPHMRRSVQHSKQIGPDGPTFTQLHSIYMFDGKDGLGTIENSDPEEVLTHTTSDDHSVPCHGAESVTRHNKETRLQYISTALVLFSLVLLSIIFSVALGSNHTASKNHASADGEVSESDIKACYDMYPKFEKMSTRNWWDNKPLSEEFRDRYTWFRDRQPYQPMANDETMVLGVLYTVNDGKLKMSVFFPPLYPREGRRAKLSLFDMTKKLMAVASCIIQENTWHCPMRATGLSMDRSYNYLVSYQPDPVHLPNTTFTYTGSIPRQREYPKIAALGCFGTDSTKDKTELVNALLETDPDVLVLQGDQTYMFDVGYGILELIYTIHNVTRNVPTLVQMDDHDYGEPNLWGAEYDAVNADSGGGFHRPPCIVNAVQRLSMSHMPDPSSTTTLDNGIDIYFTTYSYGSVDFAVLEARKFKSLTDPGSLLGGEQEQWLQDWCRADNSGRLRVVLTQTPFGALATNITLPGRNDGWIGTPIEEDDTDTNAYPPDGRQRFMEIAKGCTRLLLSGDQHVGLVVSYDDYGISECVSPAVINTMFWRLNFETPNSTHYDFWDQQHTLLRAWNVEDWLWRSARPRETQFANDTVKAARAEGFLVVEFQGDTATCGMHGYRLGHRVVWEVELPVTEATTAA